MATPAIYYITSNCCLGRALHALGSKPQSYKVYVEPNKCHFTLVMLVY